MAGRDRVNHAASAEPHRGMATLRRYGGFVNIVYRFKIQV
jgi:hypothetical protein